MGFSLNHNYVLNSTKYITKNKFRVIRRINVLTSFSLLYRFCIAYAVFRGDYNLLLTLSCSSPFLDIYDSKIKSGPFSIYFMDESEGSVNEHIDHVHLRLNCSLGAEFAY